MNHPEQYGTPETKRREEKYIDIQTKIEDLTADAKRLEWQLADIEDQICELKQQQEAL